MKRVLLILQLLLLSVAAFAQKPIYVYFNDGTFQAFLSSQVDRIAVVHADSIPGSDNYVQEVWTPDSVYRYPVASIDSIGSYMPPTKFKSGAVDLSEDLFDYVVSADTTHIFLLPNTPDNLIPRKGQKLGYPTIDDLFPYGFAGEVTSVQRGASQIVVDCAPIDLDQVFDTFYCVVTSQGSDPNKADTEAAPSKAPLRDGNIVRRHFDLPTNSFIFTPELSKALKKDETLALKGGEEGTLALSNTYDVTVFYVVNHDMGYNAQVSFIGHHDLELKMSVFGGISYERDFPKRNLGIKKHIGYGVCFFANPGTFINASAIATYSGRATQHFVSTGGYEYCSTGKAMMKPHFTFTHTGTDADIEGTLDGRLAVGGFIETGLTFGDQALDKVAFRVEAGVELTGSAVLYTTDVEKGAHDTSAYQKLKKSPISLNVFASIGTDAGVAIWDVDYTLRRVTFPPLWKRDFVPTFSNTKFVDNDDENYTLNASTEARGDCLFPVPVSFVVFDKDEKEVANYSFSKDYTNIPSLFHHDFDDLDIGKYTVYPHVTFMGFELLASPSATYELKEYIPAITSLSQVSADRSEDGFYYGDVAYRYKYELMVNAKIKSLRGVHDWGIVYKDPTGKDVSRSFMPQGTSGSYTFNIYTNQNPTSSSVHTYVVYTDYEKKTGEPYRFDLSQPFVEEDIRKYLVHLYETTDGDNWLHNDNWCSDLPVTKWYGVRKGNLGYAVNLSDNNLVGYIDMSGCTALSYIDCDLNPLTSVNLSGCTSLLELDLWLTREETMTLTSVDVSGCTALTFLSCANESQLNSLNVTGCTALTTLDCSGCQLPSIDVSGCTSLTELRCSGCPLTSLDVSGCTTLTHLYCYCCQLTSLDVSGCTALNYINLSKKSGLDGCYPTITSLDVSGCASLTELICSDHPLTSLDLSGCTSLVRLECERCQLTSLNVSSCTELRMLYCRNNSLTSLNVSGLTKLRELYCSYNSLTSLNVTGCIALVELYCDRNQLTNLNVTGCTALFILDCRENRINQVLDEPFLSIPHFKYDKKYDYHRNSYTTNPYGWWYPGEPGDYVNNPQ